MQEKSKKIRISVVHVKGARGLLDWTIADLAQHSGVAVDTINKWENRKTQPRESTREAIHDAFVRAGIEFTNGGDPGVKLLRSKSPRSKDMSGQRIISLICALSAASVVHAQAQPTAPQKPTKSMVAAAERYFRDGVQFTEEGNYAAARAAFEAGYSLSLEPDFLHNLSWTAEREGKTADAIAYAERYLAAKPDAENAERTRRRIALLRSRLPAEPTTAPTQPAPAPTQPAPAPTQAPQIATSGPQGTDKPASRTGLPPGAIGLLVGGGALTLAGIGCLAGASVTSGQAQAPGLTFDEWSRLGDRGRALNTAGLTLAIVGGAVTVGGGVWAIVSRKR